ncbi:MAG: uracil-DNA glycosylase [Planctomycetes bacterium]|nr:uracil-DNA glycosylase [Planctomycetota bacterium]
MDATADSRRIERAVIQTLESLERAGVAQLAKPLFTPAAASTDAISAPVGTAPIPAREVIASPSSPPPPVGSHSAAKRSVPEPAPLPLLGEDESLGPDLPVEERTSALQILRQEVAGCTRCQLLADTRTQTVFGVGNVKPRLCFFGEAPGADEDEQGEPFVGRAGQLLTNIIKACRMTREGVYILNVLKCRPPNNRNPEPAEIANCRGYFERQLEILRPEFICCLGSVAAKALLQTEASIGKLRGRFHDYRGARVICTYHPAYLLRNPAAKRDVWEDMKMLMRAMGMEVE